jgi:predicted ferric reductase
MSQSTGNPVAIGEVFMSNRNFIHQPIRGRLGSGRLSAAFLARPLDRYEPDLDQRTLPWFGKAPWGMVLCALYPSLAIAPLVALHALNRDADYSTITEVGIDCAQVGFALLSMQFVLTARLPWIEAPFGQDVVLRFHRAMAFVILALLCAHPLLIAGDQGWRLLTKFHAHWYIWAGRIALILLIVQVTTALLRSAMRLSYERWRQVHTVIGLAILAIGFTHAVMTGQDLHDTATSMTWALLPTVALAAWLYARGVRPYLLARHSFRVQSVTIEAPTVWSVTLEAPAGRPFHFLPGQFQFLRFLDSSLPSQEHPFTIASSPSRPDRITLTIKASGDFTSLIDRIKVGDRATVHGPFGRFSHDLHPDEGDMVFVAGGVGITPLMSMLRAMRDRREPRQVTLIYASRKLDDILFILELFSLEAGQYPYLKVIYVLSQPPSWWTGETGRINASKLDQWCGGLADKAFYLCCPPQMNVELMRGLRNRGVNQRRLHCDYFSL